jgi:hypothetical protein
VFLPLYAPGARGRRAAHPGAPPPVPALQSFTPPVRISSRTAGVIARAMQSGGERIPP